MLKTLFLSFFCLVGGILSAQHKKSFDLNFGTSLYNHRRVSSVELGHQNIASFGWGVESKINRHLRKSKINLSIFAGVRFLQLPVWYMRTNGLYPNAFIKTSKSSYYLNTGLQIGRSFSIDKKFSIEPFLALSFIMMEFAHVQSNSINRSFNVLDGTDLLTINERYRQDNATTLAATLGFNVWYQHSSKIAFAAGASAQNSFYPPIFSEFRYSVFENQNFDDSVGGGSFWLESSLANISLHTSCRYFW